VKQTQKYLKRFKKLYMDGTDIGEPLEDSLRDFYTVLISFACTIMPLCRGYSIRERTSTVASHHSPYQAYMRTYLRRTRNLNFKR
jgi:hypothetical protein